MDFFKLMVLGLSIFYVAAQTSEPYYGTSFDISELAHGVRGKLNIINETHILLTEFYYDGTAPGAHFFISTTPSSLPNGDGVIVPDENGSLEKLGAYSNATLLLTIPSNINMVDLVWFSIWEGIFNVDFGHVIFGDLTGLVPKAMVIGQFYRIRNIVRSGDVEVINNKQIMIMNFYHYVRGPAANFYIGESSSLRDANTIVPDENGSTEPLGEYRGQTIVLTLPDGFTVHNIKWISVRSRKFAAGVRIPENLLVPVYIAQISEPYYGTSFDITGFVHDVRGKLHIINENQILLTEFYYDGHAPAAHFTVSTTPGSLPSADGIIIPDENGSYDILGAYSNARLLLTLPSNINTGDLVWFSIWDVLVYVEFGNVLF